MLSNGATNRQTRRSQALIIDLAGEFLAVLRLLGTWQLGWLVSHYFEYLFYGFDQSLVVLGRAHGDSEVGVVHAHERAAVSN